MALSHLRPAIAFEKFLQAFVCFSDELLSSSKPVIVLAYQKENNQDQVKKCFLPLAFLLLERDDIILSQKLEEQTPSLIIYKSGSIVDTIPINKDNQDKKSLKETAKRLVCRINYSPLCANEAQLENCLHPIDYRDLLEDVEDYTAGQPDFIANAGNVSSLIWHAFMKANRPINWAGFYYVRPLSNPKEADHSHILILGPFMGKPACTRIRFQDGVCGAAASTKQVQRIADVHQFKGHIACDGASKSELVVPIFNEKNEVVAVIDIDSPREEGFTVEDERRIQDIATHLSTASQWLNMNLPFTQN